MPCIQFPVSTWHIKIENNILLAQIQDVSTPIETVKVILMSNNEEGQCKISHILETDFAPCFASYPLLAFVYGTSLHLNLPTSAQRMVRGGGFQFSLVVTKFQWTSPVTKTGIVKQLFIINIFYATCTLHIIPFGHAFVLSIKNAPYRLRMSYLRLVCSTEYNQRICRCQDICMSVWFLDSG